VNGHDEMLDDVAAYALGVLPSSDVAAVEEHISTCAECRAEYDALAPAVTAVGYSAEVAAEQLPGPELKARIMRAVRSEVPVRRRSFATLPAYLAAAACICIAAGLAWQNNRLRDEVTIAQRQSAAQRVALAQQTAANAREQRVLADLAAGDARRYPFEHGAVVTRGSRVYVAMHGTAQLPAGRVYQAWTLAKGAKTVRPSVTFTVANSNTTIVEIPAGAQSLAAVAVSIEPAGGSRQPTTKPIALVKLNS
jgi:anti-sigma-K factor RskA